MLKFAGAPYRTPSHVYVHGFITVSGEKMSKSRGTGISPLRYLELGMNAEWLRYYIAAKLNSDVEDIDFNPDDFVARVNSDLIGKYVNIASRCAGFISKRFAGKVSRPHERRGGSSEKAAEHRAMLGAHRAALRESRVRKGTARNLQSARSDQSVHRRAQALGARQAPGERLEAARGVLDRSRHVLVHLDPVEPRPAGDGGEGARVPQSLAGTDEMGARRILSRPATPSTRTRIS